MHKSRKPADMSGTTARLMSAAKAAWPFWLATLVFLGLFILALPHQIVAIKSDDFGYLLSITDSIARHRPVTNGWLAPYAVSNSVASAIIYFLAGSFYAATYGALLVYAALFCILLYCNLRPQLTQARAALVVLATAIFPVIFYKLSDFTSSAQSWVLFLGALLAFRHRRTALFAALVVTAFANRQNYLGLFAIPLWVLVTDWYRHRRIDRKEAAIAVAGMATCLLVMRAVPPNFFRGRVMSSFVTLEPLPLLTHAAVYFFCLLCFHTIGTIASRGIRGMSWPPLRWPVAALGAIGLFLIARYAGASEVIRFEAMPFKTMRSLLSVVLVVFLTGGALFAPVEKLVKDPMFWGAAGLYAVSALSPAMWDYYMVEAVLFGLVMGSRETSAAPAPRAIPWLFVPYAAACLVWIFGFAREVSDNERQIIAYETLLRSGAIGLNEISRNDAFAYCQYKLYDFAASEYLHKYKSGFPYPDCGAFLGGSTVIVAPAAHGVTASANEACQELPLSGLPAQSLAALNESALRCQAPAAPAKLDSRFRGRPFPLSDAEWRAFIKENRLFVRIE
jgi:hypothetical protein